MLLIASLIFSAAMGITALVAVERESQLNRLDSRKRSDAQGFAVL